MTGRRWPKVEAAQYTQVHWIHIFFINIRAWALQNEKSASEIGIFHDGEDDRCWSSSVKISSLQFDRDPSQATLCLICTLKMFAVCTPRTASASVYYTHYTYSVYTIRFRQFNSLCMCVFCRIQMLFPRSRLWLKKEADFSRKIPHWALSHADQIFIDHYQISWMQIFLFFSFAAFCSSQHRRSVLLRWMHARHLLLLIFPNTSFKVPSTNEIHILWYSALGSKSLVGLTISFSYSSFGGNGDIHLWRLLEVISGWGGIRRNRNKERRCLKIHTVFIPDVISPYRNGRQDNALAIRSIGFIFIVSELPVSSEAPSAVTFSSLTSQVSAPVDFSPFRLSSLFLITSRPCLKIPLLPVSVRRKYRLSLCACLQRCKRCSDPKANEVLLKVLDVKQQSESN